MERVETQTLAWLLTLYVGYYYFVVSAEMPMVRYFVPGLSRFCWPVRLSAWLHYCTRRKLLLFIVTNLELRHDLHPIPRPESSIRDHPRSASGPR